MSLHHTLDQNFNNKDADEAISVILDAPIGFFKSTPDGRFLFVNPALAVMHGYESPEDLMSSITDIATQTYVNPSDRDFFFKIIERHWMYC